MILLKTIIRGIIDPFEGKHRSVLIALGGVIVNDIEDHFDARRMERADHRFEFVDGIGRSRGAIARVGSKIAQCVVSPVVRETAFDEGLVVDVVVHGHEFHGGDSKTSQMLDCWLGAESRIGAAQVFGDFRMEFCEAFHMEFVDDRVMPWGAWGRGTIPVKWDMAHASEWSKGRAI